MDAIRAERQGFDETHRTQQERPVEMREERSAARRLETQGLPERLGADGDQEEIAPPSEMLRRRLGKLFGGREMNEAVAQIRRRAAIDIFLFGQCAIPPRRRS